MLSQKPVENWSKFGLQTQRWKAKKASGSEILKKKQFLVEFKCLFGLCGSRRRTIVWERVWKRKSRNWEIEKKWKWKIKTKRKIKLFEGDGYWLLCMQKFLLSQWKMDSLSIIKMDATIMENTKTLKSTRPVKTVNILTGKTSYSNKKLKPVHWAEFLE